MKKLFFLISFFSFNTCFAQNDTAGIRLNIYRFKIAAVLNKCDSQYLELDKAIKFKNITAIETGRQTLLQYAISGLNQLKIFDDFDGDGSLKFSCREAVNFYKQLAESDITRVRDFFTVEANYLTIKKSFENISKRKRSQKDIDQYNAEVKKYSDAYISYNQLMPFITIGRKTTLYNWNGSQKIFIESHKK